MRAGLVAIALVYALPAFADDATQDKANYNLFNPVPDTQMRSFSTDRPTKSDTPYTVDAGHFQYEADFANWIYDSYNASHTTTSGLVIGDPTLKLGLTNRTDLEVALAPIAINQLHDRAADTRKTYLGFGDVYARMKVNLLGNDGGDYAIAFVPYVKAPTASRAIGNGHWEGGGYVPFVAVLPEDWILNITSEIDFLQNAALDGTHTNFTNLINFSHPLFTDTVTGYVEFWSDVNNDAGAQTQYTADFAVSWLVKNNMQLDAGVNVGLNKAANDVQPYIGISQRF